MSCHIRPYERADKPGVLELSLRAWGPVFEAMEPAVPDYAFYPDGWRTRQASDIEAILDGEEDRLWVAACQDGVFGRVGVRLHPEDRMGEIHVIAVDPHHQHRGIGAALIDRALGAMREAGMTIAMVETGDDPGHSPSRAVYEARGFERWPVARYFRKLQPLPQRTGQRRLSTEN